MCVYVDTRATLVCLNNVAAACSKYRADAEANANSIINIIEIVNKSECFCVFVVIV